MLWMGMVVLLVTSGVQAQSSFSDRMAFAPGEAMFSANELSLDLGGAYTSRDRNGNSKDAWGPAVGLNYFFTENIGVGADTYSDGIRIPYMLNGSVIFRYPLREMSLSPYVFAGAGRQWERASQWTGHLGIGVEYRFNAFTSAFTDLRGVFPDQTDNYATWRFGFRVVLN